MIVAAAPSRALVPDAAGPARSRSCSSRRASCSASRGRCAGAPPPGCRGSSSTACTGTCRCSSWCCSPCTSSRRCSTRSPTCARSTPSSRSPRRYRPLWLGLGALALDLLIALVVTSLVRARLGLRAWRAVHWVAYACWPVALLHGLGTGTDASAPWLQALAALCAGAVAAAVAIAPRALAGPERRAPRRRPRDRRCDARGGRRVRRPGSAAARVGAPRGHARRAPRLRVERTLRDGRAASYDRREGRRGPVRRLARRPRAGAPHRDRRGAAHPRPDRGGGGAAASRHAAPRPSARERRPRDVLEPRSRSAPTAPRRPTGAGSWRCRRPGRGSPRRAGCAADPAQDGAADRRERRRARGPPAAQELVG